MCTFLVNLQMKQWIMQVQIIPSIIIMYIRIYFKVYY
jgi:hypothetical protein